MAYIKDINEFLKGECRNPAKNRRNMIFDHFLNKLVVLAKSVLNWVNLPDEIPEIMLEDMLLFNVVCVFFKDDVAEKYNILPAAIKGSINRYRLPNKVVAIGADGYRYNVDLLNKEGVIIFDNYNRRPIIRDLIYYADQMTELIITRNVNLKQQRQPIIYRTTAQGKQNLDRAMQAQEAGAYACVVDKTLGEDIAQPLYTPVPYIAGEIQRELEKIWNEALTFIGIVNVDEKAERLNSFEVGSQIEEVVSFLNTRLKSRQDACKHINNIFGLDMEVIPASWQLARSRSDTLGRTPEEPEAEPREKEVLINET